MNTVSGLRPYHSIYSVIMAFSVENAISKTVEYFDKNDFSLPLLATLMAFIFTVVAFYHGTISYWEKNYGQRTGSNEELVQSDFYIAMIHAVLFVAAANYILLPQKFAKLFVLLLLVDIFAIFVLRILTKKLSPEHHPQSTAKLLAWIKINAFALGAVILARILINGGAELSSLKNGLNSAQSLDLWTAESRWYYTFIGIVVFRFLFDVIVSHRIELRSRRGEVKI